MSLPTTSKVFILQNPPTGPVDLGTGPDATFALKQVDLPPLKENQVLLQTVYLSNDPAQRGNIQKDADPERAYAPLTRAGDVMGAGGIAKVIKSTSPNVKEGSLVFTRTGWREYLVADSKEVKAVTPPPGLSPSVFVGALGGPGLTAYFGLVDVLKFQKGQSIVVSGAAGAVGNIVVQYAKHVIGASKVIAIAGSDDKCEWVKKLGADVAINYKSSSFAKDLVAATEGYVDAYFDNVGGPILNLMFTRIKRFGRIAACGAISAYNDYKQHVYPNYFEVIKNRLTVQGFIVIDYINTRYAEGVEALTNAIKSGKLVVENAETVKEVSFEEIPQVWGLLFTGGNTGKLVTQIAKV